MKEHNYYDLLRYKVDLVVKKKEKEKKVEGDVMILVTNS